MDRQEIVRRIRKMFKNGWFYANMLCTSLYLFWRLFFTIPFEFGLISTVAGMALLVVEVLGMVEAFIHYANMYDVTAYPLPDVPVNEYPDVDVFISTYNEEEKLLYKTILACKRMEYPDKSRVHIYLCDDGHRDSMRQLTEEMGGITYLCRDTHEGQKAGNLNHAMTQSSSPYIVTFDADMIPKRDFLLKTMPYFVDAEIKNRRLKEEEKIPLGFLQTPQSFYDLDLFQFHFYSENRIPNEQDYFYRDIQVARTRTNSVIYGGSNTIISRKALEEIGGFYTKSITEDFATGLLIEKAGYVSLAISEPLASGMSANSLQGLIQQRVRWARGVIGLGRKMKIFRSKNLSLAQKLNYWASIWYWYAPVKRLVYILSPILFATFGFQVLKCTLPEVLLFWLPMYVTSNVSLRMLSQNIRSTKWTSIYETALFPFMILPVILESFGLHMKKFKVTQKSGSNAKRGENTVYAIPFWILIVLSVIGIIRCVTLIFDSGNFSPIVVLFWLVYNLFLLIMSLFFVNGRTVLRKAERVRLDEACTVCFGKTVLEGRTRDISETGVAVYFDAPFYCPFHQDVRFTTASGPYQAELDARLCYVGSLIKDGAPKWVYAYQFTAYHHSYDDLLGILYDRVTTMPAYIQLFSGVFDDLSINLNRRIIPPYYEKRKSARILIKEKVRSSSHGELVLHDFNYQYATFEGNPGSTADIEIEGVPLCFQRTSRFSGQYPLYQLMDYEPWSQDSDAVQKIAVWLKENQKTREESQKQPKRRKQREFDEVDLLQKFQSTKS